MLATRRNDATMRDEAYLMYVTARRTAHAPPPETSLVRKAPRSATSRCPTMVGSAHTYKVSAGRWGVCNAPSPAQTSIVGADVKVIFDKYDCHRPLTSTSQSCTRRCTLFSA